MTVHFFGTRWDAPVLDNPKRTFQMPTPIGRPCYQCHETIVEGDRGFYRAGLTGGVAGLVFEELVVHVECEMLSTSGHIYGVCHCTGYDTSARSSALTLLAKINERRAVAGMGPL